MKYLLSIFQDGVSDSISSKRVVTLLAFIFVSIAFFANLFFRYEIDVHVFDGMMYIAIAGLGVTVAERFARKDPPINKHTMSPEKEI